MLAIQPVLPKLPPHCRGCYPQSNCCGISPNIPEPLALIMIHLKFSILGFNIHRRWSSTPCVSKQNLAVCNSLGYIPGACSSPVIASLWLRNSTCPRLLRWPMLFHPLSCNLGVWDPRLRVVGWMISGRQAHLNQLFHHILLGISCIESWHRFFVLLKIISWNNSCCCPFWDN